MPNSLKIFKSIDAHFWQRVAEMKSAQRMLIEALGPTLANRSFAGFLQIAWPDESTQSICHREIEFLGI